MRKPCTAPSCHLEGGSATEGSPPRTARIFAALRFDQNDRILQGVVVALLVVTALTVAGCGKQGATRYDLTGKATFQGQPIPKGYMIFAPDRDNGNSGPGSHAGILNGRYETIPGRGVIGGPHVVSIVGTDGVPFDQGDGVMNPMGRPLFPEYQARADLPKQSSTYDFDVPAETGK
jgi:hypothetical protein